ncbi:MAG: exodeoxyribonuclease VII large subunit [Candidatus Omnitrophica bacterium]|nr:exodeoxyribonuclease VII large subunit [Candidatus Omnitrophota bacterium]
MPQSQPELFGKEIEKNRRVFTVSEITQDIKIVLEATFGEVWIEGEVSNFQPHVSGHFYFSLKDDAALLPAVMFARANKEVKFKLENGIKILCFGKISSYAPHGKYQIIVERIEPKGIGSLALALEQLKKRLEKEGLFALEHKRKIPYLPSKIGIVTSGQGAAIKDMLKVVGSRFKDVHIILDSVRVQGEGAKEEIAQGIEDLNRYNKTLDAGEKIEVLIVGRGGGSIEDLWAFNEEVVARAIYNSEIPVVSAVGHERDWTIADLVSDVRAATPSVAAEMVIPKKEELQEKLSGLCLELRSALLDTSKNLKEELDGLRHRFALGLENVVRLSASELESTRKKLALLNPALSIQQHKNKVLDMARQIQVSMQHFLSLRGAEFRQAAEQLGNLSPLNILARGYSITFKMPQGEIIKEAAGLHSGDIIKSRLHNGEIISEVKEIM